MENPSIPHVVIVGGGFGGLLAAKSLGRTSVRITLIDRNNHHLFQPLLYQVATAGLSPADIARPIRSILRRQPETEVLMGEVVGVNPQGKSIQVREPKSDHEGTQIQYDYLILATGARH